jgi:hypothetical protein
LFSKIRKPLAICVVLVAAWFLFFEYDWIGYPRYEWGDEICYSPNHEYYIVRLQTPFSALFSSDPLYTIGTAKLYDKSGKLLYKGKTLLDGEAGPMWAGAEINKPCVFFVGLADGVDSRDWWYDLPTSPGVRSNYRQRCF